MKTILKKSSAIAIGLLLSTSTASAQVSSISNPMLNDRIDLTSYDGPVSGNVEIAEGKSKVLQFDKVIGHSLVSNPAIANIIPMTDKSLYVLGKQNGTTSLTLFDKQQKLLGVFDLNVSHDIGSLKRRLYELAADENIQVRSNKDSLILSGTVSNPAITSMAGQLAEQIAPGNVLNLIKSVQPQQVMLKVQFAEVQRSVSKDLGLSLNYSAFGDNFASSGILGGNGGGGFANGVLSYLNPARDVAIDVVLDALEENGVLTTLAEPTLVAVSGETASFLAGGEFPIPVASDAQAGGITVTIEFKEFGVKLAYTPTIIGDTINLVIEPEVSVLDPQNGITLNNIAIPGLITRRASTTVDLKNGQSFAIAGLLQDVFQDDVRQIPGLGSIPIIGALARSSSYEKAETELIMVATPYIVAPHEGSDYLLPTDTFQRPTESELFLNGQIEGQSNANISAGNTP